MLLFFIGIIPQTDRLVTEIPTELLFFKPFVKPLRKLYTKHVLSLLFSKTNIKYLSTKKAIFNVNFVWFCHSNQVVFLCYLAARLLDIFELFLFSGVTCW